MARLLKFLHRPVLTVLFGGLLMFSLVTALRSAGELEFLELSAYDWFLRLEQALSPADPREPRVTLIEISEQDIIANGRWPLTDASLADATERLLTFAPRAVGLDIYRDILVPPGSQRLFSVFHEHRNVVGVRMFGSHGVSSPAVISNPEQVGFNDILVDRGGIVRRGLLFLDDGKNVYSSFALRLASFYLDAEGVSLRPDPANPQHFRLGESTVPPFGGDDGGYVAADDRGYQFLLDFKESGSAGFRSYPLAALLAGQVPAGAVRNKVVIIGVSSDSVKDYFYTPLSRGFGESQQIPGVRLHGRIVSQLLRIGLDGAQPTAVLPGRSKGAWTLLWSLAGGVVGLRTRSALRFSLLLAGALTLLVASAYLAFLQQLWVPLVPPALSLFLSAGVVTALVSSREKQERTLLMGLFSRHVSKEIAEVIWEQRDQFMNNGRPRSQKMTVTVFFSDLKGFTARSEQMDPQGLIDWLNGYMESMTRLIMDHGGVIDDYAGDGIKANFGVPLPRLSAQEVSADAVNAVACALAMQKELLRLNALHAERGLPAMGTRIGIYTGEVVTGLLGSAQRLKYTTVGDTVNVAARLESYDKAVGTDGACRILIGEPTLRHLDDRFVTEGIGELSLKGKEARIAVHRVLGRQPPPAQTSNREVNQ